MRDNWGTSTARGYWILTLGRGLWQPHPKATSRSRLFLGFPKIRPAQLHLLDTQSCAYKFPLCIQGSFAGKALLEKLLTSHKEGPRATTSTSWNCWDYGISGIAPKILVLGWCPEWGQDWISSCWGRKEKQLKIKISFISTRSGQSLSFPTTAPPSPCSRSSWHLCTDILGWSYYKGRWIFIVRRMLPSEILHSVLSCLFTTAWNVLSKAWKSSSCPLISGKYWFI